MNAKRFNLFPNKTYFGHMVSVATDEDGKDVFHVYPFGGDENAPTIQRIMVGPCRKECSPCTHCKLAWRQLHPVAVG